MLTGSIIPHNFNIRESVHLWLFFVIDVVDLRKQARRLETEIDSMLVSLSKISTNNPMMYSDDESQLLLSDDRFDTATSEIEELLSKVNYTIHECTQSFVNEFLVEYCE